MQAVKRGWAIVMLLFMAACGGASTNNVSPRATIISQTAIPPTATATPQLAACPPFVGQAFSNTRMVCDATQRNQVCYSSEEVEAQYRSNDNPPFSSPGDIAALSAFSGFNLVSTLNPEQWGIVLMRLQANLPNTLPGENVTVLLFGNANFNDGGAQGYYFTSGIGSVRCNDAPADGLLVQSPEGAYEITLRVNGADISLGSTAYLQAQPNQQMRVNVLEGRAVVTAQGQSQVVVAGARTTLQLDANNNAITPPTPPEPYTVAENGFLPVEQLEREIDVAPPWQAPTSLDVGTFSAVDTIGNVLPVLVMARPQGETAWLAGTTTGTLVLPVGTYEIEVGAPTPTRAIVEIKKDALSTLGLSFGTVRLQDADGVPSIQTMHLFEPQGRYLTTSDIGEINLPPGNYRVDVQSSPAFSENITVNVGETTLITLNKTGTLQLVDPRGQLATTLLTVSDARGNVVGTTSNGTLELAAGNYTARVSTNPVIETEVTITIGEVTRLQLPNTGVVQVIDRAGQPVNVTLAALDRNQSVIASGNGSLQVSAGTYEIIVQTTPPIRQSVTLVGGDTQTITVDRAGTIQLVDERGQRRELLFAVNTADGATIASSSSGTTDVQPSTYTVTILTVPNITTQVTVRSGETTSIPVPASGTLQTVDPNNRPYSIGMILNQLDGTPITTTQESSLNVQAGDYSVTLLTTPTTTQRISIVGGRTTSLQVPFPATLEVLENDGTLTDKFITVYDLQGIPITTTSNGTIDLLPSAYRVDVATNPTTSQTVRLAGNQTAQIVLPPSGFIQAVDTNGQPLAIAFGVYVPRSLTFVASTTDGRVEVQEGTYVVQYTFNNETQNQFVSVKGGTVTFVVGEVPS
jgi:hypothetical protein